MFGLGKILTRSKNTKVVKTKSGSSTFTKIKKQNGKTSWYKSGGTGSFKKRAVKQNNC